MPTPPITIQPLDRPFDITFPDVDAPGGGIHPIPGSKSLTNRALLLAALSDGRCELSGVLDSDDARRMLEALDELGFEIEYDRKDGPNLTVTVNGTSGKIPAKQAKLHLGNAGTAMRFLTAACCLGEPGSPGGVYELSGIPRMHERPIAELVEPLRQLGANIEYLGNEGYPPLRITACGLAGGALKMKPTLSSQFISALLQVAPYMPEGLRIDFDGQLTSEPYVRMTLKLMQDHFKADVEDHLDASYIIVKPKHYAHRNYHVEPDASSASYFFAAAAAMPGSTCRINGLGTRSLQGDVGFATELTVMGATTDLAETSTTVSSSPSSRLRGYSNDLNHIPDAAMTIATLAVLADGPTTIRNVGNWRVKETDRMAAMETELRKLGATVQVTGDDITITPPAGGQITPAAIDTYDDHRMAMAFSVIGLAQPGVTINDPDCVNKTFPDFFKYLDYLRQPPAHAKD